MVQVLEGENAVLKNREIMGATNPAEALAGTLRADYADSIDENAVHLSLIHISEPTRLLSISYAVFCLKKKNERNRGQSGLETYGLFSNLTHDFLPISG